MITSSLFHSLYIRSRLVDTPERNKLIAETYFKIASPRKTVAFCCNISHAENLKDAFINQGISCDVVHSKQDSDKRAAVLKSFRDGAIQVGNTMACA